MEYIKDAALCLIFAAAAGTLVTVIVPRGSMDKTVRAVVGIFVVAVICSPLTELDEAETILDAFAVYDEETIENLYTEDMHEYITETLKENITLRIKEIVSDFGADAVSVNAEMSVDENNCINIHKIEVIIKNGNFIDKTRLSEAISRNLGVPADVIAE